MQLASFDIARPPRIVFGAGRFGELAGFVRELGTRALLVTGARSFCQSPHWERLQQELRGLGVKWQHFVVTGEPSPDLVDEAVSAFHGEGIAVVVGIGGGSVLDAAKAIAGLLPFGNSVLDHLEDVGRGIPYTGPALPLIAVPTTAGTGSEATKNAVLSRQGEDGYKKSFRHDSLVARIALVDPELLAGCPRHLVAANGMDAMTQLLESFVSKRANPFTDALAWSGLKAVNQGLLPAWEAADETAAAEGRGAMAYGALLSGITLAQVGLGSVHGLAQPLGSLFPLPHGVACGATLAAATAINIDALRERAPDSPALSKYAQAGRLFGGVEAGGDEQRACKALVSTLQRWTRQLEIPSLSDYGIGETDIGRIVANSRGSSMKSNPIELTDGEIGQIVHRSL